MSIRAYAPAIRDAIAKGNLAQMKRLLARSKTILKEQGDLPGAVKRLEEVIEKLSKKQ